MNRRDFIKAVTALAGSAAVPALGSTHDVRRGPISREVIWEGRHRWKLIYTTLIDGEPYSTAARHEGRPMLPSDLAEYDRTARIIADRSVRLKAQGLL